MEKIRFQVYRYNPDVDSEPFMKDYEVDTGGKDLMVLDVLALVKEQDPTLAYRRSSSLKVAACNPE